MRVWIIGIVLFICFRASAQQQDSTAAQGEVLTGEVVIEKSREINLPKADKIYQQSPLRSFGNEPLNLVFESIEPTFNWPDYKSEIDALPLDREYPVEANQNYVKLGYGNFQSPLFEAGLFQVMGVWDTNAKLYYERFGSGPVNGDQSGNLIGGVQLNGTLEKDTFTFAPGIMFQSRRYQFYGNTNRLMNGFDPAEPQEARLDQLMVDLNWSTQLKDVVIDAQPYFAYDNQQLGDGRSLNKETSLGADFGLAMGIDEAIKAGFDLEGRFGAYNGGRSYNRSLLNVRPWVTYKTEKMLLKGGVVVGASKVGSTSNVGVYPAMHVTYQVADGWHAHAFVDGGQQWNGLNDILDQNEFMDDSLNLFNTEDRLSIGGGISGKLRENLLLEAGVAHSSLRGLPFFAPSASDSSRYTLAYDTETVSRLALNAKMTYMPSATSTYGIGVEINGFTVESLIKPWHRPAFQLTAFTSHSIKEKFIVSARLLSMGGIRAPANVPFGHTKISDFIDLSISTKYLITSRASAFIQVNNLLNNEYERYLGYPIRGLAFKIGGQYRF